jgi:UDP-N-acetylmuramyl pentapeptide synthase
MLEQSSKTLKTPHNINTELGVSNLIISKLNNTYSYFVAEMGAYKV